MVSIRSDRPVSLVSAFEEPVRSKEGYVEESIKKLTKEYKEVEKFVEEPLFTIVLSTRAIELSDEFEKSESMKDILS